MILRAKTLVTKSCYYELIETAKHNNTNLQKIKHMRLTVITAECPVLRVRQSSEKE